MKITFKSIFSLIDENRLSINLTDHSLKVGNKFLIKDGVPTKGNEWGDEDALTNRWCSDIIDELNIYYQEYKHSRPTSLSKANKSRHFVALDEKDLSVEDYNFGLCRHLAQFRIEYATLYYICLGLLRWDAIPSERDLSKYYYFRSSKGLILKREWFSNIHY